MIRRSETAKFARGVSTDITQNLYEVLVSRFLLNVVLFHTLYLFERLRGGCGNVQTVHLRSQTDEFCRLCRTRLALELAKKTVRRRILWMIGCEADL